MKCEMKTSGRTTNIALEGECTIERAAQLKEALLEAVSMSDHLVLNLEKVTAADITFFQLICSAHRATIDGRKSMSPEGDLPEICARVAGTAGYSELWSCSDNPHAECFWSRGRKIGGHKR